MYYILLDTETTNDIECPFCYDFGFSVIDEKAKVYETFSFVVAEIFLNKELMENAYFSEKIPQYWVDIENGTRKLARYNTIRKILKETMKKYRVDTVIAHNVRFDYLSSQTTQRYLTKSKYRWFFPYGTRFCDTLKMARDTFSKDNEYIDFCLENGFYYGKNSIRYTAEILYRYLTQDIDFIESHTGLEDVLIEKEIFKACLERGCTVESGYLW